eukprot:TRINITY_DN10440_c0_g1_i1.p1 TRINITY_DN10440_c0_g1~~TRINITY_DN10440_c0_g1_i1.p1  ORF type:complete len:596 (-),score=51.36 TRINITY_DN10440_c0_g1_i1:475-2262(-)
MTSPYSSLGRDFANYESLTPISFLERAALVFPERRSIIYGQASFTWAQTYSRCRQMASALQQRGIGTGQTVAFLAPNVPAIYEAHFGVPMAGAVLNTLNIRLDATNVAKMLRHGEAEMVFVDEQLLPLLLAALRLLATVPAPSRETETTQMRLPSASALPFRKLKGIVVIPDHEEPYGPTVQLADLSPFGSEIMEYENFLSSGDAKFVWAAPSDELAPIALNYTSGTTSDPKGVVTSHRACCLNSFAACLMMDLSPGTVCLWTVPMFHCNGWNFTWVVAALAGTNVCLRTVRANLVFDAIKRHGVTFFCAVPAVLLTLVNATEEERGEPFKQSVKVLTGGAPPPASILEKTGNMGLEVTHSYGLTETNGPSIVCAWKGAEWDGLPLDERARLKSRQGVKHLGLADVRVCFPGTMDPVPRDGMTIGEVMIRGNTVMLGYLKNKEATKEAFRGGYFHSGDLAVVHPDGYLEIKDRAKDIIISGGENVSSVQVEDAIYRHPSVVEVGVVARPDERWGESPCAFVVLKDPFVSGVPSPSEADIIACCKRHLPGFMVPRTVVFSEPLPRTSTGKLQKFSLRERARKLGTRGSLRDPVSRL